MSRIYEIEKLNDTKAALLTLLGYEEEVNAYEDFKKSEEEFLNNLYLIAANPLCDNIRPFEAAILGCGNPKYNYLFAKDVKGADILAHGQAIIDSKDIDYNIIYPSEIEGADILAHRAVILEYGDETTKRVFDMIFQKELSVLKK